MKKLSLLIILCFSVLRFSYGQHPEIPNREQLKQYNSYTHKIEAKSCWKYVYELKDGLIVKQETYCKRELRNRTEFEYDQSGIVEREIVTYDINKGNINYSSNIKLEYKDSLLISREFSYGTKEKYSDFNQLGKPQKIERIDSSKLTFLPYKELIEYNKKGNITKTSKFSSYKDLEGNSITEIATTHYKYNDRNDVIEIYREYEPKQEFPIPIAGGPFLYEYEYFRYKYNKNGLWIKKYKAIDGKEYLIAKRKYK